MKILDMKRKLGKTIADVSLGLRGQAMAGESLPQHTVRSEVSLDDKERKIFDIVRRVAEKHGTEARVAGGWVRDKLLGKESHDIDFALDHMTGLQFAKHIAEELGIPEDKIVVVKANPDKSKHLETAMVEIEGIPIDLVNLRSEKYTESSRNPEMVMGTADEDAARRDITINSLFYNIHTNEVEDKTGKGIADLKNGVIRTPIHPKQTFLDDPLRALRVVRFASRFGFNVDEETKKAMADPEVHAAFKRKVTDDRLRKEFEGALQKSPANAVRLMMDTGLIDLFMPELRATDMDQQSKWHDKTVFEHTMSLLDDIHKTDPDNIPLKLAALLHDIGKPKKAQPHPKGGLTFIGHEDESAEMVEPILSRLHFKTGTGNVVDSVKFLVKNHMLKPESIANMSPLKFGRWLRDTVKTKENLTNLLRLHEADMRASAPVAAEQGLKEHAKLLERLKNTDVDAILSMEPLVNGKEIMSIYKIQKGGPWIGKVKDRLLEMQLSGRLTTKEQALEFLHQRFIDNDGNLQRKKDAEEKTPPE